MALDSESRWRLVRMKRAKGDQEKANAEPVIRKATEVDLNSMVEIYNYYIQNSVVTFDLDSWLSKTGPTNTNGFPSWGYLLSLPKVPAVKLSVSPMLPRGGKKLRSSEQ